MREIIRVPGPTVATRPERIRPGFEIGPQRRRTLPGLEPVRTATVPDSFLDYWDTLFAHRKTLVLFALAGLIGAVLIGLAQTPLYRARTSLEIQNFNDKFLDLNTIDPTVSGIDLPLGPSYLQTQVVMLQSQTLLERVIDTLNLQETRPPGFARLRQMLGLSGSPRIPTKEELIRHSKANLTVRAARETRVLEIQYQSPDPRIAADFANTLVGEYIDQAQEMRLQAFQRTAERLTAHLREMKGKLEEAEAVLQDYVRTSGLAFTSEKDNVADVRLVELQAGLSSAQADRIATQVRFEQARITPADALPELLDDPALREYRLRLTDLQRQLVELTATLTPAHYKVLRVQAQIDELQSAVQKQRDLTLNRIGSEYAAARRREEFLAKAYSDQLQIVTDQSSKGIRYRTLKGEVDSTRQLYESMLERVKQAELAATMRASNVLVIDTANVPTRPFSPNLPMNAAVGLFGAAFLGLGFVFFRERVDRRIQAPGETRAYLNVAELGVIPARAGALDEVSDQGLVTAERAPAAWTDCYSSVVTSILLANPNEDTPRVVVVTSPYAGDGKTTVAGNLSLALVAVGKKVLVIDGDLRRPKLHEFFGLSNREGLSDWLGADSDASIDEDLSIRRLIAATRIPGVSILPAGRRTAHGSHLLHSARMSGLLDRLRAEFDVVVVDAPPVIPVPDARVLGRLANATILVIRAGRTTIEGALAAKQRFAEDGTPVLGTILNDWNPKSRRRYGYGGYYDAYGS
jgi:capsular exopolysaccharide synthesis family protein